MKEAIEKSMKATIDLVIFQRELQEKMYFDAFGEPMQKAIKRRFKDKPTIL